MLMMCSSYSSIMITWPRQQDLAEHNAKYSEKAKEQFV